MTQVNVDVDTLPRTPSPSTSTVDGPGALTVYTWTAVDRPRRPHRPRFHRGRCGQTTRDHRDHRDHAATMGGDAVGARRSPTGDADRERLAERDVEAGQGRETPQALQVWASRRRWATRIAFGTSQNWDRNFAEAAS